jgi:hypothetical protein
MAKAVESEDIPASIVITPKKESQAVKDDAGMDWTDTTFSFALSMPPRASTIPITMERTEQDASISKLDPSTYKDSPEILAAYEFYYAGGGFQAVIRKAAGALVFQKRMTSEGSEEVEGGCDAWSTLGTVAISAETKVTVDDGNLERQESMVITCPW